MSKGILEFNLPEEQEDFHNAAHGAEYRYAIHAVDERLRGLIKYGREVAPGALKLADEVRGWIREELDSLQL